MRQIRFFVLFSIIQVTCFSQNPINFSNTKKDRALIVRSTLGICGLSKTITTNKGNYFVSQSIGQASVIGRYKKNGYTFRQGFQQPVISVKIIPSPLEKSLKATIFPNPFRQSINISFDEIIENEIRVIVYDVMGRTIYSQKFPASQLINMPLSNIPSGIYVLKVTSEKKQIVANLIKQ